MIVVAVGTYFRGFDALIAAADAALAKLELPGFAQIGHSTVVPRHLEHARFLPQPALLERLARSELLICHAGMGLIGDGLRAGCRIIVVPRMGAVSAAEPINDQRPLAQRLARELSISLCERPEHLGRIVPLILGEQRRPEAPPTSGAPRIIAEFLTRT